MQLTRNAGWVRLLDSESAVPTGSIWLGPVGPADVVICTVFVRSAPRRKPQPPLDSHTNDVHQIDRDLTGNVGDVPAADSSDIDRIREFVSHTRLDIVEIDPERRTVVLSGTAAAMAKFVRAQLVRYKYARKIRVGYIAPIYVAAAIADIVERVGGFDDSPLDWVPSEVTSNGSSVRVFGLVILKATARPPSSFVLVKMSG